MFGGALDHVNLPSVLRSGHAAGGIQDTVDVERDNWATMLVHTIQCP